MGRYKIISSLTCIRTKELILLYVPHRKLYPNDVYKTNDVNMFPDRKCRPSDEFTCSYEGKQPQCIPKAWVCDMDNDCADSIDEQNCGMFHVCIKHFTCVMDVCITGQ